MSNKVNRPKPLRVKYPDATTNALKTIGARRQINSPWRNSPSSTTIRAAKVFKQQREQQS